MKQINITPGTKLDNGAVLISSHDPKDGMGLSVLAIFRGEFVTWKMDSNGGCYWGHYHGAALKAAVADLYKR